MITKSLETWYQKTNIRGTNCFESPLAKIWLACKYIDIHKCVMYHISMIIIDYTWIRKRIITTGQGHSLAVSLSTSASLGERCCWRLLSILHVKDLWSYPSSDHLPGKWPHCRGNSSWCYLFSSIWHFHDNYWKQGNLDVNLIYFASLFVSVWLPSTLDWQLQPLNLVAESRKWAGKTLLFLRVRFGVEAASNSNKKWSFMFKNVNIAGQVFGIPSFQAPPYSGFIAKQ